MTVNLSWTCAIGVTAMAAITMGASVFAGAAGAAVTGASDPTARAGVITTIAGGPGGPAPGRMIAVHQPCGVASDTRGLYMIERAGDRVRLLAPRSGLLTEVAGPGTAMLTGLSSPCDVAVDAAGNLVFADTGNNVVRVIAAHRGVFYGKRMRAGHAYVVGGNVFASPEAVIVDGHGNLLMTSQTTYSNGYETTTGSAVIKVLAGARGTFYGRRMMPGRVYPLASGDCPGGAGLAGCAPGLTGDGGPALAATFGQDIWGLATDRSGNVAIADTDDNRVRVVAERTGRFYGQNMTAGDIYSIAGGGTHGLGDGGPGRRAALSSPWGVAVDRAGNVVVSDFGSLRADAGDRRVRVVAGSTGRFYERKMTVGDIYTIAGGGPGGVGDGEPAIRATLRHPAGLAFDSAGNLAVADLGHNRVRLVAAHTGRFYGQKMKAGHIYTIAGNGYPTYSGDGGLATLSQLAPSVPAALAVDRYGNIVVTDAANNRVRVIAARTGVFYRVRMTARHIYTVAGTGRSGFSGDGGLATRAQLAGPDAVAIDHAGNILVGDVGNYRVRVVAARTGRFYGRRMTAGHIYFLAGGGTAGGSGLPPSHVNLRPTGLAVDAHGNVLIANALYPKVLVVRSGTFYGQPMKAGLVYNLYVTSVGDDGVDNGPLAVDHAGNVVVASPGFSQIDVIAVKAGKFYGIRMRPEHVYDVDANLNSPSGVAVDAAGNLLIADTLDNQVRVLAAKSGTFYGVRTIAGNVYVVAGGGDRGIGDGGPATQAELSSPCGIAPYGRGLVVLDALNYRVRLVSG